MVPASTGAVVPTQEMLAKLKSELDVVQGNVRVMSEMLTELTPSDVDSSDLELLQVSIGPKLREIFERKIVNIFLFTSLNMCCGCSKEPSH